VTIAGEVVDEEHTLASQARVSSSPISMPLVWRLGLAAAAAVRLGVFGWGVMQANSAWLATQLSDDAYYYLEIAQRIARGEGATLDRVNPTNGFHPLWEGVLSFLALFFGGQALVKAALLVGLLMFGAALMMVGGLVRRRWGDVPAAVALVAGVTMVGPTLSGMEMPVLMLTLALLAWTLTRYLANPDRPSAMVVGLATGACVLARLDFLAVAGLVPVAMGLRVRRLREVGWTVTALATLVLPWFGWSWLTFGRPFPVSGAAKLVAVNDEIQKAFGSRLSNGFAVRTLHNLKPVALNVLYRLLPRPETAVRVAFLVVLAVLVGVWLRRRVGRSSDPGQKDRPISPQGTALLVVGVLIALQYSALVIVLPGSWIYGVRRSPVRGRGLGRWSRTRARHRRRCRPMASSPSSRWPSARSGADCGLDLDGRLATYR